MSRKGLWGALFFLAFFVSALQGEPLRVFVTGWNEVSLEGEEVPPLILPINGSALILLRGDLRFFKGIELELTAPQESLDYRGSLALALYRDLSLVPEPGIADLEAAQFFFEPLPAKIKTVYQIPLKAQHGLKTSPYAKVVSGALPGSAFPLLFRFMPVIKGISERLETMTFSLSVKPLYSGEGAVRLSFRYPGQLPGGAFTALIDDQVLENREEEILLKEGEHSLQILSEDYRNESRRFQIEQAKILNLNVELQDPTPLLVIEAPENARVYLDNALVRNPQEPFPVSPGVHEVKFQVGDYGISKTIRIQKGKTYRAVLAVDLNISEE